MLTALDTPAHKAAAFACGADDYITKPFDLADLLARVRVWGRAGRRIHELHELRQLYAHTRQQAMTDPLTGLYNRRALETLLEQEIAKVRRLGYSLGVFVLDVDQFKTINDRYGHLRGDQVLGAVARALRQTLRKGDILGRFGGDEFVAVLLGSDPGALRRIGEQLRRVIAELPTAETGAIPVTVSIGGATSAGDHVEATGLLSAADAALYQAKAAGRNRVVLADELPAQPPASDPTPRVDDTKHRSAPGARTVPMRERRQDPLLRSVVGTCQPRLEHTPRQKLLLRYQEPDAARVAQQIMSTVDGWRN
jgi:diguanylate cyclase (GGDEF)-like protein